MRHSTRTRLMFIEKQLETKGRVNKRDLQEEFGISSPQACTDFRNFEEIAPGHMKYCMSDKCYKPTKLFKGFNK